MDISAVSTAVRAILSHFRSGFQKKVRHSAYFNNEAQFELLTQFTVYCVSNKVLAFLGQESVPLGTPYHLADGLLSWEDWRDAVIGVLPSAGPPTILAGNSMK